MKNFADRLIEESRNKNSALIVGLDPDINRFPDFLIDSNDKTSYTATENMIFNFNKIIIDAVHEHAVAIKPQLAYYEVFGSYGLRALERTIEYAKKKKLIVICDAKRNDISSSSEAYAKAFLSDGPINADMMTVNPYLGSDGYNPFIEMAVENNKGIFLLLKTSNPSSAEIQDLVLENGELLHHKMASDFHEIALKTLGENNYSSIGVVVGATYPSEATRIRELMPNSLFLIPGLGAQGGSASDLIKVFDKNGEGAFISSSRGIIYAYETLEKKELNQNTVFNAIRDASIKSKNEINIARTLSE